MKRGPPMRAAQISAAAEIAQRPTRHRTDRKGVALDPAAYQPLKELSLSTKTPIRDLLSEAVALLLRERCLEVPTELRRKLRGRDLHLD